MQQALEALDCIFWPIHLRELNKVVAAMNALRERLAQPEQEPVAYIGTNGELMWLHKPHAIYSKARPLYTAPPQRKPLTDEDDRLIAAAPELLAALQGLLKGIFDGPDEANAAMLIAKARDAVNKATGEK
jgi:hypothetical protein